MTPEDKKWIDEAPLYQLLGAWRYHPAGSSLFQGDTGEYYSKVMFKKRKENNQEWVNASKTIGWRCTTNGGKMSDFGPGSELAAERANLARALERAVYAEEQLQRQNNILASIYEELHNTKKQLSEERNLNDRLAYIVANQNGFTRNEEPDEWWNFGSLKAQQTFVKDTLDRYNSRLHEDEKPYIL